MQFKVAEKLALTLPKFDNQDLEPMPESISWINTPSLIFPNAFPYASYAKSLVVTHHCAQAGKRCVHSNLYPITIRPPEHGSSASGIKRLRLPSAEKAIL